MLIQGDLLNAQFIDKLNQVIWFDKDLIDYVFKAQIYNFWFFERDLISFQDIMQNFISVNILVFKSKPVVFFGNPNLDNFSYFTFNGSVVSDLEQLREVFEKKFIESNCFPIIFTNENFDWMYFESLYEEVGVIAVKDVNLDKSTFIDFLNENFLPFNELDVLYKSGLGKFADMIKKSYFPLLVPIVPDGNSDNG